MKQRVRGFTIVEVLIVIVVIGILASLVMVTFRGVQERSKRARVQAELTQIKHALLAYKSEYGELPPNGDWTTINWEDDSVDVNLWRGVLDSLVDAKIIGPGLVNEMLYDPWGRPYAYDDNDCNAVYDGSIYPTYLRSVGPDGRAYYDPQGHTDDEQVKVTDGC